MRIVKLTEESRDNILENLLKRSPNQYGKFEDTVNEILENVSSINNQIARSECWVGEASDYYVNKSKSITACFDELYSEFNKSALYLDKVIGEYEDTDSKVVSASTRIGGSVNKNTYNRIN